MTANVKPTGRARSIPAGLAMGAGVSLLITLILSAIIAMLTEREILPETGIGYAVMVLLFTASISGSITSNSQIKHRQFLVSILSGCVYYAMLLGITALFFGGQYQALGVTALVIAAGCILPLLISGQGRRGAKRKTYKIPSR